MQEIHVMHNSPWEDVLDETGSITINNRRDINSTRARRSTRKKRARGRKNVSSAARRIARGRFLAHLLLNVRVAEGHGVVRSVLFPEDARKARKGSGSRDVMQKSRRVNAYDSTSDAWRNVGHMTWSVTRDAFRNACAGDRRRVHAPARVVVRRPWGCLRVGECQHWTKEGSPIGSVL